MTGKGTSGRRWGGRGIEEGKQKFFPIITRQNKFDELLVFIGKNLGINRLRDLANISRSGASEISILFLIN